MTVTAGLDIGTTSVKAVAVDDDGNVVARARLPHRLIVPAPDRLEHDAVQAWWRGPRRALAALATEVSAVAVAAMTPSLTAVDARGRPLTPGLLYGDSRGRTGQDGAGTGQLGGDGEAVGFLRWTVRRQPGAAGYWPAPAVANRALGGEPVIDIGSAFTSTPLFGPEGDWDDAVCAACGVNPEQLPRIATPGAPIGRVGGDGPVLTTGAVDVECEQLVAGADSTGDIHVLCGTTLIVWAVTADARQAPGLWSIPHRPSGLNLVGGASNAGGLFLDWVGRMAGRPRAHETVDPGDVPVWAPYPRGERTPYHDPRRRAALDGLDLTHGAGAVRRAAWEASGFVVRHLLQRAGVNATRVVATGGGTRVTGWLQALADATGLPVHAAAVPEGAAQGAAFVARVGAGLEADPADARRWARTGRVVYPDSRWVGPTAGRYERFLQLSERELAV